MTHTLLFVGACMFCFGMLGFLTRRNLILMFLSLEMMLAGVSLNFIAFGRQHGDLGGQTLALLILTVAACEAALALSLIVALVRSRGTLDVDLWRSLNELSVSSAKTVDDRAAVQKKKDDDQIDEGYGEMPKLTPAGLEPLQHPIDSDPHYSEPATRA